MAQPTDRRPLRELWTLYDLEPRIRDVVLEGRRDVELVRWYLSELQIRGVQVYTVDDRAVVDRELCERYGADVGARGRTIALALAAEQWNAQSHCLTCVVDADWDYLRPGTAASGLLKSDFGALDVYALDAKPVSKLLQLVLGRDDDPDAVIATVLPALCDLSMCRLALHESGLGVQLVDSFVNCLDVSTRPIVLDQRELFRRSLGRAELGQGQVADLMSAVDAMRAIVPTDPRTIVRGHDMAPVLIRTLALRNEWARVESLERAWRTCLDATELSRYPLFQRLLTRLTS